MNLAPDQSKEVEVTCSNPWNPTSIEVTIGEHYAFKVLNYKEMRDAWIEATPDGLVKVPPHLQPRMVRRCLRCPTAEWYALTGTIGHSDDHAFLIGSERTVEMKQVGEIYLFVNDVHRFYWNNRGCLRVLIRRCR
jgi:hypothetical protein